MLMSHNTNNTLLGGCCFSILLMFSLGICCICQMYLYLPDVFVFVKAASVADVFLFGFNMATAERFVSSPRGRSDHLINIL